MPLRDHFRSPVNDKHRWDAVHGQWPGEIVRTLFDLIPEDFVAEPKVYHRSPLEDDDFVIVDNRRGVVEFSNAVSPAPTVTIPTDLTELDEYEIEIYDMSRERRLVAAIEIVSPANKDRPGKRDAFLAKVGALLRREVCVSIVDIVTVPKASLYAELLARVDRFGERPSDPSSPPHAATFRMRETPKCRPLLDAWYVPMALGEPLPNIPLRLSPDIRIELPLEPSYQEVCRLLRIR